MERIYNYDALISDVEKYIKENGRFLFIQGIKKPHETLYKALSISRRTYFLWLKKGILDFNGVVQYDKSKHCNVYDLQRLLDKIKNPSKQMSFDVL